MPLFNQSVTINRPVADVFAFLVDVENEPKWQKDLTEAKVTSPGPIGIGSTGEDLRTSGRRQIVTKWEVTQFEPNTMLAFKVTKPVPFTASYQFDSLEGGTKVTVAASPARWSFLLWPLFVVAGKKQYTRDFASLKRVLET